MKRIFLFLFILAISGTSFGQRKTRRQQKQEAYELKMKQEWDAYLVKVEESKELKAKQKAYNDSVKSVTPKKDSLICDNIAFPTFVKKDFNGKSEKISYQDYINLHIKKNFMYPEFAMEHNIQGRVLINYVINKEGYIEKISADGPENGLVLEEEAVRIMSKLPKFIPAKCNNEPISVKHAIPIIFRLQ